MALWKKFFANLITESERPQCEHCALYRSKLISATSLERVIYRRDLQAHLSNQKRMKIISSQGRLLSMCYPEDITSIVVDNMTSKSFPKFRRETTKDWSQPKLLLHIGKEATVEVVNMTNKCGTRWYVCGRKPRYKAVLFVRQQFL